MLNTLSSRATFYDVIGYLVPGIIALGIGWLWLLMIDQCSARWIANEIMRHGFYSALCVIAIGYVVGHLVNALSSLLIEKHLFKTQFAKARQWYDRMRETYPAKARVVVDNVKAELDLEVTELSAFDIRIRMEEKMPSATVTGFSFLSFYGMSRTLALLAWSAAVPIGMLSASKFYGGRAFLVGFIGFGILALAGALFCYQYIRFVKYYYDFLGSTLLHRIYAEPINSGKQEEQR